MTRPRLESTTMLALGLFLVSLSILVLPILLKTDYVLGDEPKVASTTATEVPRNTSAHLATPEPLKAIYITACVAATPSWRTKLEDLINKTELNAVVIDIKDYSGTISYKDENGQTNGGPGCIVSDMKEFLAELHQHNIYTIGRITVFQDPLYTKVHPELAVKKKSDGQVWTDKKGLAFIDVGAKPYWDFVVSLAKKSYDLGFDEINFDYIRYPSDGDMSNANYTWSVSTNASGTQQVVPKSVMLKQFFSYLHDGLKGTGMKTSADLFGLVTVAQDDMGIGQVLENALPYFDYIAPMVYPSHFASGTQGFSNPAEHPYEIIKYSMSGAVAREQALNISNGLASSTPSKLRPWLQDFDLGATYGVAEVQAQMKGNKDSGLTSWMMWDAGNKYTPEAYLPN